MISIKEMDQNNWVCYKFGDNSYYYGEVGLLDQNGVVHPKDNAQLATDPKVKLVKNGFGIFIYDDSTGQARYEGQWAKDQKNGKGILRLKDGSNYQGYFKDGFYQDNGILKWPNGDVYDGRWKKGRMQGPGLFKKANGFTLKGSFKNNYFVDSNVLRNPFMAQQQYQDLKKRRKQISKQYQKNEKIRSGYLQRISGEQIKKIMGNVQKSAKNNRVALIVCSQESGVGLAKVVESIKTNGGGEVHIIDLRKSFKLDGEEKYNYIKQVQSITQKCMKNGGTLILSLDDSEEIQQFEQLYYPQVKQLYSTNGFNSLIWSPKDLQKPQIRSKLIGNNQLSPQYVFAVWSKVKLSQTLTNDFLREKLQKRFESILPFIKIDMVFVEKGKKLENQQQIFK